MRLLLALLALLFTQNAFAGGSATDLQPGATAVLTAGYSVTPYGAGTQTTGAFTPDIPRGNFQYAINGGAHTLVPPIVDCNLVLQYTNNGSAGAISTSGFTIVTGSSLTTASGDDFILYITKLNNFSHLNVVALQ
jgi:hypothetical protein